MPHQWKPIDRLKDNDEFILVIEADKKSGQNNTAYCLRYQKSIYLSRNGPVKSVLDSVNMYYDSLPKFHMSLKAHKVPFKKCVQ